jgi:hypothetical protein
MNVGSDWLLDLGITVPIRSEDTSEFVAVPLV